MLKLILLSIFVTITIGKETHGDCQREWTKSESCYNKEIEKIWKNESYWKNHFSKINGCFDESKCDVPTYNRNPLSDLPDIVRKIGRKVKEEWANTSAQVKQCVKEKLGGKLGEELAKCLERKHVEHFNFSQFMNNSEHDKDNPIMNMIMGDATVSNKSKNASHAMKKALVAIINVVYALRTCNETKQTSNLEHCLKGRYSTAKKEFCQESKSCRNSTKSDCQSRGEAIYKAVCECKQEKIRALVTNLDKFGQSDNVSMVQLIQALSEGHNISQYRYAVKQCYRDYNQTIPPIVAAAIVFSEHVGEGNEKNDNDNENKNGDGSQEERKRKEFTVDRATLNTIRDFLQSQSFDEEECSPCT